MFDLKGSKVHRFVDCPKDKMHKEVLKDENFLRILRARKVGSWLADHLSS